MDVDKGITAWSVPKSNNVRFEQFSSSLVTKFPARMASLICNRPSIVGYSILWECGLVTIHIHRNDEDRIGYQFSPYESWLHMPVDPGEVITEIWLRQSLTRRERALAVG